MARNPIQGKEVSDKTGVKLNVRLDVQPLEDALQRLAKKDGGLLRSALASIGEILLQSTRNRFARQTDPQGRPWAPLNPAYRGTDIDQSGKRNAKVKGIKKGPLILVGSGMKGGLLGSIVYQLGPHRLILGTNKIYGATHQFGATIHPKKGPYLVFWLGGMLVHARKVTIPARPFLGVSADDRAKSIEAVKDIAEADWAGR